jgi:hypothetical protein
MTETRTIEYEMWRVKAAKNTTRFEPAPTNDIQVFGPQYLPNELVGDAAVIRISVSVKQKVGD